MTAEEVFAQLRDVHSPEVQAASAPGLDPTPLIAFTGLVLLFVIAHYWIRWRGAKARLNIVDTSQSPGTQRDQIAVVLRNNRTRNNAVPVPSAFFAPPERVSAQDAKDLRKWAQQRLR